MSDLSKIENTIENLKKKNKGKKIDHELLETLEEAKKKMEDGYFLRECFFENKKKILNSYNFITIKPQIYVCNVDEDSIINGNKYSKLVENFAEKKMQSSENFR